MSMCINRKHFKFYKTKGLWWFRIFGYGIHFKDVRQYPLLFSERCGYRKTLMIGNMVFGILKPPKISDYIYSNRNIGKRYIMGIDLASYPQDKSVVIVGILRDGKPQLLGRPPNLTGNPDGVMKAFEREHTRRV